MLFGHTEYICIHFVSSAKRYYVMTYFNTAGISVMKTVNSRGPNAALWYSIIIVLVVILRWPDLYVQTRIYPVKRPYKLL